MTEYIHKLELELETGIALKLLEKATCDGIQCDATPISGETSTLVQMVYPEHLRSLVFRRYQWLLEKFFTNK